MSFGHYFEHAGGFKEIVEVVIGHKRQLVLLVEAVLAVLFAGAGRVGKRLTGFAQHDGLGLQRALRLLGLLRLILLFIFLALLLLLGLILGRSLFLLLLLLLLLLLAFCGGFLTFLLRAGYELAAFRAVEKLVEGGILFLWSGKNFRLGGRELGGGSVGGSLCGDCCLCNFRHCVLRGGFGGGVCVLLGCVVGIIVGFCFALLLLAGFLLLGHGIGLGDGIRRGAFGVCAFGGGKLSRHIGLSAGVGIGCLGLFLACALLSPGLVVGRGF